MEIYGMRKRRISRAGRISALLLAFIMAFLATSVCMDQTAEASNASMAGIRTEEELGAMLSVGTVVRNGWQNDAKLKELLNRRNVMAAEYAGKHRLNGTINVSESPAGYGESSDEWLSNVLYKGEILRCDSFDGFIAEYNGGADAVVIDEGINEIDVLLIPIADMSLFANGVLNLSHRIGYRTRLFVVGIKGRVPGKDNIYERGKKLDYASYLLYIGAQPSDANLLSYLMYLKAYEDIAEYYVRNEWLQWPEGQGGSGSSDSDSSDAKEKDTDRGPKGRTIMIYMDGADLGESAMLNLYTMITESTKGSIGRDNHIVILTGGSRNAWNRTDGKTIEQYLYNADGVLQPSLAETLGTTNQLWELADGRLTLIKNGFNNDGYMTQGSNLAAFIQAVKSRYPEAQMYDLIMWDHGGGPEGGFGKDERRQDDQCMSLVEITDAISGSGVSFDLIVFDACLMSNAEVAIALAPYTKYFMLSEQEFPGQGLYWGYSSLVSELIYNNNVSTIDYAQSIITAAIDSYDANQGAGDDTNDAIMSLIDASRVNGDLAGAIAGFAEALMKVVERNDQATLDFILKTRKSYTYVEGKSKSASTRDLIDLVSFCDALMGGWDGELKRKDEKLYEACDMLKKAANDAILYTQKATRHDNSRELAEGTEPTGISIYFPTFSMSVTPLENPDGVTDQVLNLISAYKSSDRLDSYGKALAAYGLWLKVGKLLGNDVSWYECGDYDDEQMKDMVWGQSNDWSMNGLYNASGLTKEQADNIIEAQIRDRIKKSNITATQVMEGANEIGRKLTVTSNDPDLVDRIEAKIYVNETVNGKTQAVSLGKSNFVADAVERSDPNGTATANVNPYDNKWLVLDGKVVSYYDTEDRSQGDKRYRVGVIPVAYWKEPRKGDDTDKTLKAAIDNDKVMVGVFEIRFLYDENTQQFSQTGTITDFRKVNDSSIAISGYTLNNGEIYELLAGFDDGADTSQLRSIGVVRNTGNNLNTATFQMINDLQVGYSIVDVYESRYDLDAAHFPDDDAHNSDLRNLDDYRIAQEQSTIAAPVASMNTADQSGLGGGTYDDRESKSAGTDKTGTEAAAGQVTPDGTDESTAGNTAAAGDMSEPEVTESEAGGALPTSDQSVQESDTQTGSTNEYVDAAPPEEKADTVSSKGDGDDDSGGSDSGSDGSGNSGSDGSGNSGSDDGRADNGENRSDSGSEG
jgi:hypothetical protein